MSPRDASFWEIENYFRLFKLKTFCEKNTIFKKLNVSKRILNHCFQKTIKIVTECEYWKIVWYFNNERDQQEILLSNFNWIDLSRSQVCLFFSPLQSILLVLTKYKFGWSHLKLNCYLHCRSVYLTHQARTCVCLYPCVCVRVCECVGGCVGVWVSECGCAFGSL